MYSSDISIVIPVYGAEKMIPELVDRIRKSVLTISSSYEILLIEDNGKDNSWEAIEKECALDKNIKGFKLSRNFGQHNAIAAGLEFAKGEWIVVMDCDLQDLPEEIPKLYQKAKEGFEIVQARRVERQDTFFKRMTSKVFYATLSYLTGVKQDSAIANFGIYNYKVVEAICNMKESIKYFPTMVRWVGFKSTAVDVKHAERPEGSSSYNLKKLLNLALNIILAYSDKPLRITAKAGFFISVAAFIFALIYVFRAVFDDFEVSGYASVIISIWFFSGLIIFFLGIIGLYVGKIFEGVKARQTYVFSKVVNNE